MEQLEVMVVDVGVDEAEEVDEVEVNIFVCVSVKIGQNCTFSLFFGHNQPEKVQYMCFIVIFSMTCFGCPGPKMEGGKTEQDKSNPQPAVGKIIQAR